MVELLDPTDERVPIPRHITPRPEQIAGTVGLLDISKEPGDVFLDRVAQLFAERLPGVQLNRYKKPAFGKPAPADLRDRIVEECDFVIEGLAD